MLFAILGLLFTGLEGIVTGIVWCLAVLYLEIIPTFLDTNLVLPESHTDRFSDMPSLHRF